MSKRYREVLEEVETPASRRAADRDGAGSVDAGEPPPTDDRQPRLEGGTAGGSGGGGGVATLVRPAATTTTTQSTTPLSTTTRGPTAPRVRRTRPGNRPTEADEPLAFTWRGRHYAVTRVLGHWREEEGWWRRPDGEPIRIEQSDLWRVEAVRGAAVALASDGSHPGPRDGHGVYELARRGSTWRLDRVWD